MPMAWVDTKDTGNLPAWMLGFSSVTSPTNERTFVPYLIPQAAVGNSTPLIHVSGAATQEVPAFLAMLSTLCFDYTARQKIGGVNLNFFIVEQLPVLPPSDVRPFKDFCSNRVLELAYTAYDMAAFARSIGDEYPPFMWDEERRFLIRAELDAFFFRLYGIERDDVDYIMETFQTESGGFKNNDIAKYGSYRTKDTILDFYDRMAAADAAGAPYETPIMPPPGHGPRHPARSEA